MTKPAKYSPLTLFFFLFFFFFFFTYYTRKVQLIYIEPIYNISSEWSLFIVWCPDSDGQYKHIYFVAELHVIIIRLYSLLCLKRSKNAPINYA